METVRNKKKFTEPQLVIYGDIRRITQAPNPNAMGDGGAAGMNMTAL